MIHTQPSSRSRALAIPKTVQLMHWACAILDFQVLAIRKIKSFAQLDKTATLSCEMTKKRTKSGSLMKSPQCTS